MMVVSMIKAGGRRLAEQFFPAYLVRRHHARFGAEEVEMSILDLIVPEDQEAIDVGANWGTYTLLLSRLSTCVHAIEPNPSLVRLLRHSLEGERCRIEAAAIGSEEGTARLHVPRSGRRVLDGLASLRPLPGGDFLEIEVPLITLDRYADHPIGFIKIDVEGLEADVLAGASRLIEARRPVLLVEIEERHAAGGIARAHDFLEGKGYEGWFLDEGRVHPMAAFDPAVLQDAARFDGSLPRSTQRYVNNFLFLPAGRMTAALRERIEARLSGGS